jgi:WD40 repeat protein
MCSNVFCQVILSPDRRILLNAAQERGRHKETIDIHYLDSGGTNNMNFSFVTRISIPYPRFPEDLPANFQPPVLAFSADGCKFAMAMACGRVSVWDIRGKVPFKTFIQVPKSDFDDPVRYLQFSSGKLGKEALVFVEVCLMFILISLPLK